MAEEQLGRDAALYQRTCELPSLPSHVALEAFHSYSATQTRLLFSSTIFPRLSDSLFVVQLLTKG